MRRSFLVLVLLASSVHAKAPSSHESFCDQLYLKWKEAQKAWATLDLVVRGKYQDPTARRFSDSLADLKSLLDDVKVKESAEKVKKVEERIAKLKSLYDTPKFRSFLKDTAKKLESIDGLKGKAAGFVEKGTKAVRLLETDTGDPIAALKSFTSYVEEVNDLTSSLHSRFPGFGDVLGVYVKSLAAATSAIEKISARRDQQLVKYGGTSFHRKYGELQTLERRKNRLRAELQKLCGEHYKFYDGEMRPAAYVRITEAKRLARRAAEAKRIEALRLAAEREEGRKRAEYERIRKAQVACNKAYQVYYLAVQTYDRSHQAIADLSNKASTKPGSEAVNRSNIQKIEAIAKLLPAQKKAVSKAYSDLSRACWPDVPSVLETAREIRNDSIPPTSGLGAIWRLERATKIIQAREEIQESLAGCEACQKELEARRKRLSQASSKLRQSKQERAEAKAEIPRAEARYREAYDKAKVYIFQDSAGNIVQSASKTSPGLSYKGFRVPETRQIRDLRRGIQAAKDDLAKLEKRVQAEEDAVRKSQKALEKQEEACVDCQFEAKQELQAFLDEHGRFLLSYGNSERELKQRFETLKKKESNLLDGVLEALQEAKNALSDDPKPSSTKPPPKSGSPTPEPVSEDPPAAPEAIFVDTQGPDGVSSYVAADFLAENPKAQAQAQGAGRTLDSGTEGLFGDARLPLFETDPKASPPTLPRAKAGSGPAAGRLFEAEVSTSEDTRWEAVKRTLRRFLSAYVSQDLGMLMRTLSSDFLQDPTVLRNALSDDFQKETNLNLDLELASYRVQRDTIQVELRWSRSATDQTSGITVVRTGTSELLFSRAGGFGIQAWFGSTPFGIFDPAWRDQASAGQQVDSGLSSSTPGSPPTPPSPGTPTGGSGHGVIRTASPVTVDDLQAGTQAPNHFFLDLSAQTAGSFFGNFSGANGGCNILSNCSQAGMDLIVGVQQSTPSIVVVEGQTFGGAESNRLVGTCQGGFSPLEQIGGVQGTPNFVSNLNQAAPVDLVVAVERPDGVAALVELRIASVGSSFQITPRWITGPSLSQVGLGSSPCSLP